MKHYTPANLSDRVARGFTKRLRFIANTFSERFIVSKIFSSVLLFCFLSGVASATAQPLVHVQKNGVPDLAHGSSAVVSKANAIAIAMVIASRCWISTSWRATYYLPTTLSPRPGQPQAKLF